ncbi:MAG TPA: lipid II flippase MurJ [Candidatus Saccharimonadales bacterium]|nr:lipid II flippase MurJ [Candidatus Saccharimonadales bacterium]
MNPSSAPAKKKSLLSVSNVAALLMATAFVGQLLGVLRTKLVNANFPLVGPHSTDAYFAAFAVPDFFFFTLAAGALGVAFIPVLTDRLHKNGRKSAWELSASLMNFLAIIMAAVAIFILVFARPLIAHVVAPHLGKGLSAADAHELQNTAVAIMRLLALNPLLFTISGILTSVQQTMGRFFFFAIAPLAYNLSIIVSVLIFSEAKGHDGGPHHLGLVGLGVGALIGAVLQLLIIIIGLWKTSFHWHPRINWRQPDFKTVLQNLPPRSLDQGMDQVESVVEIHIASGLGTSSITNYTNAFVLSTAPILLLGTAISTAVFPKLNTFLSQNRPDLFRKEFLTVLRAMIWLSAPSVVVCYFARGYLARLIYSNGSPQIATIFGYLALAIFFRIIYAIISRWFYAQKDTKTPLFVSLFTIGLNIILAVNLARPSAYGLNGLALAQSIVAMVEVLILSAIMLFRDHHLFDAKFWNGIVRIMAVSGFSVVAGFIMISFYPLGLNDRGFVTLGSKLFFITAVTFGVHVLVSSMLGLEEVRPVVRRIKKIVLNPIKIEI